MITKEQIYHFAKVKKINETTIFREYLQLLFLSELYSKKQAKNVFFKGGTALHFIYDAPRFSEDLDFTVALSKNNFLNLVGEIFELLSKKQGVAFKEKQTIAGKTFLLTAMPEVLPYKTFINLDFSFREKVLSPQKSIIKTDYPVLFTSYIYHLSPEELLAEKIRAFLTRTKGRDLYDLWYLISRGARIEKKLVKEKLKYYNLENIKKEEILEKVARFSQKDFILDVRPFVAVNQRNKLKEFCNYIKNYLKENL